MTTTREVIKAWYENRLYQEPDFEEEKFFDLDGCDVCCNRYQDNERLADDVVTIKIWLTIEDLKEEDNEPGQYYEIRTCKECLYNMSLRYDV